MSDSKYLYPSDNYSALDGLELATPAAEAPNMYGTWALPTAVSSSPTLASDNADKKLIIHNYMAKVSTPFGCNDNRLYKKHVKNFTAPQAIFKESNMLPQLGFELTT